jgi:hypothetical protein
LILLAFYVCYHARVARPILSGEYQVEEALVAATISITTLLSVPTLLAWIYALSGFVGRAD